MNQNDMRKILLLTGILLLGTAALCSQTWTPPIGIPDPRNAAYFGGFDPIKGSHNMYADQTYDYNGNPGPYKKDSGYGPYTHYVDMNHPNATDSTNPYGTVGKPRLTFPNAANVQPGAVIEIHGGPYPGGEWSVFYNGTTDKPVFFRGASASIRPVIYPKLCVRGAHLVFENIDFDRNHVSIAAVDIRPQAANESIHHIVVRSCEVRNGHPAESGLNDAAMHAASGAGNYEVHHVVYYNNHIHLDNLTSERVPYESDTNGVGISSYAGYIWVLDNHIHHGQGDSVGDGHLANYTAHHVFIGRNLMHDMGENAVDIKAVDTVIVSQNVCYGFYALSGGVSPQDGGPMVFHKDPYNPPKNVWVLYNDMYGANGNGIAVSNVADPVYIIGNTVHDIRKTSGAATASAFITWSSGDIYLINNTFANSDNGITWWATDPGAHLYFQNNIVSGVNTGGYHLSVSETNQQQNAGINHDLFYQPGGEAVIEWGSSYNVAEFQSATGKGQGCLEADPRFSDQAHGNFALQASSPAINAGIEHAVYQTFQNLFGLDIRRDINNVPRPQGAAWDMGAYEYVPAQTQTLTLNSGWNWISFNVLPADLSLNSIFSGILSQVEQVKGQTQSAIRIGGNWKGDLANMNGIGSYKMFKVKVSTACTLTVTGTAIAPTTPIPLQSGWNWVAYLPTTAISISTALASISGQVQEVKSLTQSATYSGGAWTGALQQLNPGQGYAIKMSGPGTLIYPAATTSLKEIKSEK
jgi:hypothetical protein